MREFLQNKPDPRGYNQAELVKEPPRVEHTRGSGAPMQAYRKKRVYRVHGKAVISIQMQPHNNSLIKYLGTMGSRAGGVVTGGWPGFFEIIITLQWDNETGMPGADEGYHCV